MPSLRKTDHEFSHLDEVAKRAAAILVSDVHLSHTPPTIRAIPGVNWYDEMSKALSYLARLEAYLKVPIIYAGDIFHKWNSPPELINFAIEWLPIGYAIPGQHDLPLHSLTDIHRSAYWTLVHAGKLVNLEYTSPQFIEMRNKKSLAVHGFPYGTDFYTLDEKRDLNLAVVHRYVWTKECSYPDAPVSGMASKMENQLKQAGFDAAVFGDNHIGFTTNGGFLINCGTLMRRNRDEADRPPTIGLLLNDGFCVRVPTFVEERILNLVNLNDRIAEEDAEFEMDLRRFLRGLNSLGADKHDFKRAVEDSIAKTQLGQRTRKLILQAIEE